MNRRIYILSPLILLLVSLLFPALSVSGRSEFGFSILATGWFQSYISIAAMENWHSHGMLTSENLWPSLLMFFPWFANIFIVLSTGFLVASKNRIATICSVLALGCVLVFFANPVAMLGPDGISVKVTPLFGAYLWAFSSVANVWLAVYQSGGAKEHA